jgi:hypothetical protein
MPTRVIEEAEKEQAEQKPSDVRFPGDRARHADRLRKDAKKHVHR